MPIMRAIKWRAVMIVPGGIGGRNGVPGVQQTAKEAIPESRPGKTVPGKWLLSGQTGVNPGQATARPGHRGALPDETNLVLR
jgi:hypothetical protein